MIRALYLLAAVVIATPVAAQTVTPTQAQPPANPKKSDANRIICKSEETIGSRLNAKKVCLTQQEWKDQANFYRDQTETWQRGAQTRPSG